MSVPLHYKHNSLPFKREMSKKFHAEGGERGGAEQQLYNKDLAGEEAAEVEVVEEEQ